MTNQMYDWLQTWIDENVIVESYPNSKKDSDVIRFYEMCVDAAKKQNVSIEALEGFIGDSLHSYIYTRMVELADAEVERRVQADKS